MATLEENLLRFGLRGVEKRLGPKEEQAAALRAEVALYDSPHWQEFAQGLERELVSIVWALVAEDDPTETRVLQRECRRLRERLVRPDEALGELKELNEEISGERDRLLAAAGLSRAKTDAA